MGSTTCSDPCFAALQPSFRLGKLGKRQFLYIFRLLFIWTALGKTALTSPLLFFLPLITMCQHCSWCAVAHLAQWFSLPCMFNVLFYSECQTWLTGYNDWQAAWMCLLNRSICYSYRKKNLQCLLSIQRHLQLHGSSNTQTITSQTASRNWTGQSRLFCSGWDLDTTDLTPTCTTNSRLASLRCAHATQTSCTAVQNRWRAHT